MKFFDINDYIDQLKAIGIIIGGRGIGKTYSAFSFLLINILLSNSGFFF